MRIALQIMILVFIFGFLIEALTGKEDTKRIHSFTAAMILIALMIITIIRF